MGAIDQQQTSAEQEWLQAWLSGPSRTRYSALPPQVGDAAPDVELPDTSGKRRRPADFCQAKPALVLLLRHFPCSCLAECWERPKGEIPALAEPAPQIFASCPSQSQRSASMAT